ncbi:zinc finger, CCHC-type containing protein, partial [Tanacetum coccineum]
IVTTSRYVVPTGRVKVPAGRYVVPTSKDKFIVSAGRTKVIPAGSTILVLHLLIEEQYRLENKSNDDTSKVHVVEEKGESSKAGGKKRRHDDKDKKKSKKNKKDNKDNNFVAMISEAFSLEEEKSWWVDSGATRHVCNDQTMFKTYEPSYSMLYMGNHSTAQVKGKGKIDLVFTSGNILTLNDVLHVPDVRNLSSNLISSSSLKVASSLAKAITPVESPYTPQQNGIAKRKNRTLMDMVNSMMSHSGLSSGYWGEALLTACYILNRVPSKRSIKTPYELWNRRTPKLDYLRIWGYKDPQTYSEAMKSHDSSFWKEAENDEMDSIIGNNT